jgi:hypothetical protein
MMKRTLLAFALLAASGTAQAQPGRPFGLGLVLGEPTGLTAKLYLSQPFALQFGLGWMDTFDNYNGLYLNVDFVFHPAVITRQPAFTMPFYIGVGGRLLDHHWRYYYDRNGFYDEHDTHIGVRVPFGLLMDFSRIPLDLYLELAVVVDILYFDQNDPFDDHRGVDLNGGIGARYYF